MYASMNSIYREDIYSVLVECDKKSNFGDIECSKYIFDDKYECWNRSHALNIGIQHILKETDANYIMIYDCDNYASHETISDIIDYTKEKDIFFPRISNYDYKKTTGFVVASRDRFENDKFDERLFYWGYEDDDWAYRTKNYKTFDKSAIVDLGDVVHLRDRRRYTQRPPGMKKWNCWEYNRMIVDYKLGVKPEQMKFSKGENRDVWPKEWMDRSEYYL